MNPSQFGLEDEDDEEDAALQYMIEQSLQESSKQRGLHRESSPGTEPSADMASSDFSQIFSGIKRGDQELLKDLSVRHKEWFLQTDSRGWTPLHQAAAQSNQTILEITLKGLDEFMKNNLKS